MQEISIKIIENAIQQFSVTDLAIKELSEQYNQLEIKDIDDKEGYLAVSTARKDIKARRIELEKKRKELTADALLIQNGINSEAKRIKEMLEPIEEMLSEKEKWYESEKEKIKQEKEERQKAIFKERCQKLLNLSFYYDISSNCFTSSFYDTSITDEEVRLMVDAQFNMVITDLSIKFNEFKKAEEARLAEEEADRKKAEDERLAREKAEYEERALLRKQKESMERERAEMEAEKAKLEAEKRELLAEQERLKQKIIDDELKVQQQKIELENLERQKIEAENLARINAAKEAVEKQRHDEVMLENTDTFGDDQFDKVQFDVGTQDITVVRFTCPHCKEKYNLSTSEISDLINLTQEAQ